LATGKTAKKRMINQHCTPCNKDFDMEVVEGGENKDDVIWLKCPGCQGFLPYMVDDDAAAKEKAEPAELAPEDLGDDEKAQAREYVESEEYELDEIIYHRSWHDHGKVVSKEELPGNRKTITVSFINQGTIRLLEGVTRKA
jgi:hypothetical protein